jgi:hypothetical protein
MKDMQTRKGGAGYRIRRRVCFSVNMVHAYTRVNPTSGKGCVEENTTLSLLSLQVLENDSCYSKYCT